MEGYGRCMKISLITINFVTLLVGAAAVGGAIWLLTTTMFSRLLINMNMFNTQAGMAVTLGVAIIPLSIIGCFGAAKEVTLMLLVYGIFILIIFVITLIGGIIQLSSRDTIGNSLIGDMTVAMQNYGVKSEHTTAWDGTQNYLECCGIKSYKDWNNKVPMSCCKEISPGQWADCRSSPTPATMHMTGCLSTITDLLGTVAMYLGIAVMMISLILLLAVVLSGVLYFKIKRDLSENEDS